jgi:DNA invertase Pin-like site-specific DNA recombinase
MSAKRVAIYTRVSTDGQSVENQRIELRAVAERHGWDIVAEFSDPGVSGARGRDQRPGFDKLLKGATRRDFDMIAAWSVDRLGRSLQHLVAFLGEIHGAGCDLYLHTQGLDTSTPAGRAMFGMLSVFAEFERAIITERVHAGIKRAKRHGTKTGNPFGRPRVEYDVERAIRRDLEAGKIGMLKIAAKHGVGSSVVQRIKAAMSAE